MDKPITNRISKSFGDLTIIVEISDTEEGCFWRLKCGNLTGKWSSYYSGVYTFQVANRTFIYLTGYWDNSLPVEQPLEIIQGK
jgi:hypothetical protein